MHNFVEELERLRFFMPEGVEPTAEQVLEAMRDRRAYEIDMARDRMKEEHLFDIPAMTSDEIDERLK